MALLGAAPGDCEDTPEANTGFTLPMPNDLPDSGYTWLEDEGGVPHPGADYNDFSNSTTTPIRAVANGKVVALAHSSSGLGNSVVVQHRYRGEIVYSLYGHLSSIAVTDQQVVSQMVEMGT